MGCAQWSTWESALAGRAPVMAVISCARRSGRASQGARWVLTGVTRESAGSASHAGLTERCTQLAARADVELRDHVAKVPLDGAPAEEELGADLRVRLPVGRHPGDLQLLRGQVLERLDRALARGFSGGRQLTARALSECLHAHIGHQLLGRTELLSPVAPTP